MSRLQNLLLIVWVLFLLLVALFNWPLVTRTETIGFLFMNFDVSWGLVLILGGAGVAALLRLIGWMEGRTLSRRTQAEVQRLKAKAFDERGTELEAFAQTVQERMERTVRSLLGSGGGSGSEDTPKS